MNARPDFSPAMLRTFLFARQVTRDGFEGRPILARRDLVAELMAHSGLPESDVRKAFAGKLKDGAARAAIWAALGHFPCDSRIVLTDDGGQG